MSGRLDLSPEFGSVIRSITALRHLSSICEGMGEDLLRHSDLSLRPDQALELGYRAIIIPKEQCRAFSFLLGHIEEIAREAEINLEALETLAVTYGRKDSPCA